MFRPKSKQKSIFDHDVYLPAEKVEALEKTWAGPFRRQVLPKINEESFRVSVGVRLVHLAHQ